MKLKLLTYSLLLLAATVQAQDEGTWKWGSDSSKSENKPTAAPADAHQAGFRFTNATNAQALGLAVAGKLFVVACVIF